jgi:hypothetical protein
MIEAVGHQSERDRPAFDGAEAELRHRLDYRVDADFVVACDGARSPIRQGLGLRMEGTAYEARYVIVDIELDVPLPTERLAWFDPPSNPGRTMLMHKQPDNIWRLDYQLRADEDADEMLLERNIVPVVEAHLRMMQIDRPWRLVWASMYRAAAVSLAAYRKGRVLFAGDAAHLVPIFGVRGLNSGFEDVFNLGWKLAAVLKGSAPEQLLDSYSQERQRAWQVNVASAMKSTEFMAPPSYELMRDAVLSLALAILARHADQPQAIQRHLRRSPLSTLTETRQASARATPGQPSRNAVPSRVAIPSHPASPTGLPYWRTFEGRVRPDSPKPAAGRGTTIPVRGVLSRRRQLATAGVGRHRARGCSRSLSGALRCGSRRHLPDPAGRARLRALALDRQTRPRRCPLNRPHGSTESTVQIMKTAWTQEARERAYTRLCDAITAAGPERETDFRPPLPPAGRGVSDPAAFERALAAARLAGNQADR